MERKQTLVVPMGDRRSGLLPQQILPPKQWAPLSQEALKRFAPAYQSRIEPIAVKLDGAYRNPASRAGLRAYGNKAEEVRQQLATTIRNLRTSAGKMVGDQLVLEIARHANQYQLLITTELVKVAATPEGDIMGYARRLSKALKAMLGHKTDFEVAGVFAQRWTNMFKHRDAYLMGKFHQAKTSKAGWATRQLASFANINPQSYHAAQVMAKLFRNDFPRELNKGGELALWALEGFIENYPHFQADAARAGEIMEAFARQPKLKKLEGIMDSSEAEIENLNALADASTSTLQGMVKSRNRAATSTYEGELVEIKRALEEEHNKWRKASGAYVTTAAAELSALVTYVGAQNGMTAEMPTVFAGAEVLSAGALANHHLIETVRLIVIEDQMGPEYAQEFEAQSPVFQLRS